MTRERYSRTCPLSALPGQNRKATPVVVSVATAKPLFHRTGALMWGIWYGSSENSNIQDQVYRPKRHLWNYSENFWRGWLWRW